MYSTFLELNVCVEPCLVLSGVMPTLSLRLHPFPIFLFFSHQDLSRPCGHVALVSSSLVSAALKSYTNPWAHQNVHF